MTKKINTKDLTRWFLRIGLAFVFLYAGYSSLRHPYEWIYFLPKFLTQHIAALTLIKIFAVYELALVVWLISGQYLKYCALLCALTFAGIVIMNPGQFITTFRDVGLFFMALALYVDVS